MSVSGPQGGERLDAFMGRANAAYYAQRDPFTDFVTAPEISQIFGEVLGRGAPSSCVVCLYRLVLPCIWWRRGRGVAP